MKSQQWVCEGEGKGKACQTNTDQLIISRIKITCIDIPSQSDITKQTNTHTHSRYIEMTSRLLERDDCGDVVFTLRSNMYFE